MISFLLDLVLQHRFPMNRFQAVARKVQRPNVSRQDLKLLLRCGAKLFQTGPEFPDVGLLQERCDQTDNQRFQHLPETDARFRRGRVRRGMQPYRQSWSLRKYQPGFGMEDAGIRLKKRAHVACFE
jgi:hypothetical protein